MVTNLSPLQISSNLVKKKKCGESKRNCSKKGPKKKKKKESNPSGMSYPVRFLVSSLKNIKISTKVQRTKMETPEISVHPHRSMV
jgi:hypothetical protein